MIRLLLLLSLFIDCPSLHSQEKAGELTDHSIHQEFKNQIRELYRTRAMEPKEIDSLLNIFDSISIHSDRDIARILGALYPADRGIAILFYFYSNNSLHRVLFEPGVIKEQKDIAISKTELLKLGADVNRALGLYHLQAKRSPRLRSVIEDNDTLPKPVLNDVLHKATELLLPQNLDEKYRHLVIIPALNIGSIPFHLLTPYKDIAILAEKCSFTISPGLFDLLLMRWKWLKKNGAEIINLYKNKQGSDYESISILNKLTAGISFVPENPVFVSNPVYPSNTPYVFPDLPGAKKEVANAVRYLEKYKVLQGAQATKDSVLKYINGADVFYFATHGVSSASEPMEKSFLVLSGTDPFLTAKDIMDLRSKISRENFPELVILSACQTGLGKPVEAGIAGLARAFLLAGSNNVIMSLWNVDDEATAYLMNRFFLYLQNINEYLPAEPLRLAILDTRKKFPDPSQWASFSLFGIDY